MATAKLEAPVVGKGSSYGLASGNGQWERLDAMHQGIRDYLGGKLSLAALEKPRRILELGAGSGAWAIQAAQEYPDAEVIATDINPLPPRPLPPNVKFQKVDVTGPLPFAPGSFDVVHIRFVLCHLPHGTTVIPRLADLVAPGGYLLLDDINSARSVGGDASAVHRLFHLYERYMRSNHQEPEIGDLLVPKLTQTGKFSSVGSHRIPIAINDHSDTQDPALRALSETMRTSIERAYAGELPPAVVAFGITKDVQKAFQDEADTKSWEMEMEIVLTWSRKL